MLADRDYMREQPSRFWGGRGPRTATGVLLLAVVAVFVLQCINWAYVRSPIEGYLMLSWAGVKQGYIWQFFTFQFLHGGFLHILFNGLMLYMFGSAVEGMLGRPRFLEVYFASGVLGGLAQVLLGAVFPNQFGMPVLGASAGVCGLLAMYCLLERDRTIVFMFFFPMRAITLLKLSIAVAAFFVLVPVDGGVAHAAHLGGFLVAIGYQRWILDRERRLFDWRPYADQVRSREREMATVSSRRKSVIAARPPQREEEPAPEDFISKEVDPILDKISAKGIHSLTEQERKILDKARSKMAKK